MPARYRRLLALLLVIIVASSANFPVAAQVPPVTTQARSMLLLEHQSGQVLAGVDPDQRLIPASLVKIMTLKLAFEAVAAGRVSLDTTTIVSQRAWRAPGSTMFLLVDTEVALGDLLRGIAIVSGNDACIALAELLAGTEEAFVVMMNRRAADLGLTGTRFVDSHGLSTENYTTARDVATLVRRYIGDHPQALELHSTRSFTYAAPGQRPITQFNRNLLLGRYDGADGLKTGFLSAAGYNMVATAQRDGMRLIAVLLGIPGVVGQEGEERRAQETINVLNYGFRNYTNVAVADTGAPLGTVRVWKGTVNQVTVGPAAPVLVTVPRGSEQALERQQTVAGDLVAPVEPGRKVGELRIAVRGQEVARFDLVTLAEVPRGGLGTVILDTVRLWFARMFRRI